jgi:hypothetical protein
MVSKPTIEDREESVLGQQFPWHPPAFPVHLRRGESNGAGGANAMRATVLMLAVAMMPMVAGCGDGGPSALSASGKARPHKGEKVTHPLHADVWSDLDKMREFKIAHRISKPNDPSPELAELKTFKTGEMLGPGDLIEVIEAGDDYARIDGIGDSFGKPLNARGYVRKWW